MGHGHVVKNPDGAVARCGGPALCPECALEWARKTWGASRKKTDWCPVCEQGWECHETDQKSRAKLATHREGFAAILEVMDWAADSSEARQVQWTWVVNALRDLQVGKPVTLPGRANIMPNPTTPCHCELVDLEKVGPLEDCPTAIQCCSDCEVLGDSRKKATCVYLEPRQVEALRVLSSITGVPQAEYIRQGVDLILEAIAARELRGHQRCPGCGQWRDGWPEGWQNVPERKGGLRYCCPECVARSHENAKNTG